jgi:hypothetical protein
MGLMPRRFANYETHSFGGGMIKVYFTLALSLHGYCAESVADIGSARFPKCAFMMRKPWVALNG